MLHIIFVETALELVPLGAISHPEVRRNAKRRRKKPQDTLLNRSLHHRVLEGIADGERRGRPDIINICLLEALGSPLNRQGNLKTWINTYGNYSIDVSPKIRLPRDCNRFNSLMEQLFSEGIIPPDSNNPLMTLTPTKLEGLIDRIKPNRTIALTSHGKLKKLENLCEELVTYEAPVVLIGAFPHGPMREETLAQADEEISINSQVLEAWVVTARLIYEYEKALSIRSC
jgi:rRNA small subunit pseudouridine methyltransferase Nep1